MLRMQELLAVASWAQRAMSSRSLPIALPRTLPMAMPWITLPLALLAAMPIVMPTPTTQPNMWPVSSRICPTLSTVPLVLPLMNGSFENSPHRRRRPRGLSWPSLAVYIRTTEHDSKSRY